ncbi:MAG: gamma-glutamyl-gamma-aminobutyrate hydrolase family protein [Coriobacteriales bacterium]
MDKPLIAVAPLYDDERESIWMLPEYCDMISACGAIPLMVPYKGTPGDIEQVTRLCSGLLLTGGQDVSPQVYGQQPLPCCGGCNSLRDELDRTLMDIALDADMPVLGICRGIQLINAHLGGTLYQDLPSQHPSEVCHSMEPPYNRVQHLVEVLPGTPLSQVAGAGEMGVNSYHHQAVCELASCLEPMAVSEDGLVEALWHPQMSFVWAVQWHPELSWRKDPRQLALAQALVAAARRFHG